MKYMHTFWSTWEGISLEVNEINDFLVSLKGGQCRMDDKTRFNEQGSNLSDKKSFFFRPVYKPISVITKNWHMVVMATLARVQKC